MSKLNKFIYSIIAISYVFVSYWRFIHPIKYFDLSIGLAITSGLIFGTSWMIPKIATNKKDQRLRLLYVILFFASLFLGYEMINYELFHSIILPSTIFSWISGLFFGITMGRIIKDEIIMEYPIILGGLSILVVLINYFAPFYITIPISIIVWLISLVKKNVKV